jgi:hypothetical protein
MEKHILALESAGATPNLDDEDIEDKALEMAIDEVYTANGRKWKPWAKNARSIRMGEIILLVDSDTVVPEVGCRPPRCKGNFASQSFFFFLFCAFLIGLLQGCCARIRRMSRCCHHSTRIRQLYLLLYFPLFFDRLPRFYLFQMSCKLLTISLRMVLRISLVGSTSVFLWDALMVKSLLSSAITPFSGGLPFKMLRSSTLWIKSRRSGLNLMYLKILTWLCDSRFVQSGITSN